MTYKGFNCSDEVILPSKNETLAITFKPKTSALVYDRIWSPFLKSKSNLWLEVPEPIRCFGATRGESKALSAVSTIQKEFALEEELRKSLGTRYGHTRKSLDSIMELAVKVAFREISKSFLAQHSICMIPVYESQERRNKEYHEGDKAVVIATLLDLQIVDEDGLTWEQVLEFRSDKESHQKYRRFIHWLDKDMIGRSQTFIEDEIAIKLEDYEFALKKHGFKTVLGTIQEVLDGKYLIGTAGIAAPLAFTGHPFLSILSEAVLLSGKVGVKLGQEFLDLRDIECGKNSEVAWVYEVKHLGEKSKSSVRVGD